MKPEDNIQDYKTIEPGRELDMVWLVTELRRIETTLVDIKKAIDSLDDRVTTLEP